MSEIVKMRDVRFEPGLFVNFRSGTVLDDLLCSYKGLPNGVNYMIIGDLGVVKNCKRREFCPDPIKYFSKKYHFLQPLPSFGSGCCFLCIVIINF